MKALKRKNPTANPLVLVRPSYLALRLGFSFLSFQRFCFILPPLIAVSELFVLCGSACFFFASASIPLPPVPSPLRLVQCHANPIEVVVAGT
jgi:hypothetical protein